MPNIQYRHAKYFAILFVLLSIIGGQPVEFGEEVIFFHGFVIPKPVIRVGLGGDLDEIKIASSSGMKIYEVNSSYRLLAEDTGEVLVKTHREKLSEKFLLLVSQDKDRRKAELFAQGLKMKTAREVYVKKNIEDGVAGPFQVLVGDFLTRGDALSYIRKLNEIGIEETWIVSEDITEVESKPFWILINDELQSLSPETVLYFIPSHRQSYLSFKGRDYRGILVLKNTPRGTVLINILNLEDYLKGVVPSELSPYTFNQLEAQKAQAVAARTYALRNMRLNEDLDFDLGDTPDSQYYRGLNAEHPLSSLAVKLTREEVAVHKGELIEALYTSTCGGMTENAEEIFGGPALPYLKSTECVYGEQKGWQIQSGNTLFPVYASGRNISREIAIFISLDLIPPVSNPVFFSEQASPGEAKAWLQKVLVLLGKKKESFPSGLDSLTLSSFARLAVEAFGWQERVKNLMLSSEKEFILKDSSQENGGAGDEMAYLIQNGILPPLNKAGSPDRGLTRGELVLYVWRALRSQKELTQEARFIALDGNLVELVAADETVKLALSPGFFLLKNYAGDYTFASQAYLIGGEKVRTIEKNGQVFLFEILYPPNSNILDRNSDYFSWQVKVTREELEERINEYYPIGKLIDIAPQKRGVSKRVVELLIKGTDMEPLVKGLKIRRVLGLRENLFAIEREYDAEGNVSSLTFLGKGWGHGVGLCQVGAYGMALAGADYQDILKKYYHGIKIIKLGSGLAF